MSAELEKLYAAARTAVLAGDWNRVNACAFEIQRQSPTSAHAPFLMGLTQKAAKRHEAAADYFLKALTLDGSRFDAAIERAYQMVLLQDYAAAKKLLATYAEAAAGNATYHDLTGSTYFAMSLYQEAWGHFEAATQLQPTIEAFQVHKAECAVYVGELDTARQIYMRLLKKHPRQQKLHYDLSQLQPARDDKHIKQMLKMLRKVEKTPANAIYLYYAIGKEMEDLKRWDEAFKYYEAGGNAVKSISPYDVGEDTKIIDAVIETCTAQWLASDANDVATSKTPIFIVGLPRTGTTMTDRILSSHSQVSSIGESQLLQMVLRDGARAGNQIGITADIIKTAAARSPASVADAFMQAVAHKIDESEFFVEKLPENILYLGFIAKAWPNARIVHLRRDPMDACFAMFKQSYFRFAYSLQDLAAYYLAYDRLTRHWRDVLADRVVELHYEELVSDHEGQIRQLLDRLGLDFEPACLDFTSNTAPVATASSAQVRQDVHTRSVEKWKRFEKQLQPLREQITAGGVSC